MKTLGYLLASAVLMTSFSLQAFAQQTKAPDPLPDNASLEDTGKWLIKALRKNFHFPTNDKQNIYLIDDLKFEDCLLTFNLVRESMTGGAPPVRIDTTSSNGNKTLQDRVGGKVTAPLDPNTREPRIDVGTDPNHFPAPQGAPRPSKKTDRKVLDTQMFDLYEIDQGSIQILKLPQAVGVSYLLMMNRALTAKGNPQIKTSVVRAEPQTATAPSEVISQKPGGLIALRENAVPPIRAGFEHAIKLCQQPR